MKTLEIIVFGKVQGVWFRASTKEKALEYKLVGLVKNRMDGSVIINATGLSKNLDKLVQWCRQGPEHARVDSISVNELVLQTYDTFSIDRKSLE